MSLLQSYFEKYPADQRKTEAIAYLASLDHLSVSSPMVAEAIVQELKDQRSYLKLIASENYSSLATQLAMGNLLTDKYAEGYPHHRFYAGCDNVDTIEEEAAQQARKLFNADYAYVQPHSGADANLVAFWAILIQTIQNPEVEKLGKKSIDELSPEEYERVRQLLLNQKILGLSLNSGGHLTHGYRHNISSKMMKAIHYDVSPESERIDYQALAEQTKREKPAILLAGFSAHPRKLNFAKMREIADSAGAILMVDMAHFAGLVAGKAFQGDDDPIPFAHIVTSTTHKTLRGPRGGLILAKQEFAETINKGCPLVLGGPLPHVMAAKAVAFKEANQPEFRQYASKVISNAQSLAGHLQKRGIRLVTGGTENHLMILDLTSLGLTGRQAESALRAAHLTVNRNAIPFDKNGPWYTSGIRIGTPAITTRGLDEDDIGEIASIIVDVLAKTKPIVAPKTGQLSKAQFETDPQALTEAQLRVKNILIKHPLYPELEI